MFSESRLTLMARRTRFYPTGDRRDGAFGCSTSFVELLRNWLLLIRNGRAWVVRSCEVTEALPVRGLRKLSYMADADF